MPRLALLALLVITPAACASGSGRGEFAVGCQGSESNCRTADHTGSGGANGGVSGGNSGGVSAGASGGVSAGANGGGMGHSMM